MFGMQLEHGNFKEIVALGIQHLLEVSAIRAKFASENVLAACGSGLRVGGRLLSCRHVTGNSSTHVRAR
ncbi:MAG: hypothetical protein CMJ64_23910 [Planctomycetaceae bacterium]|nr:hypothetical protein [Planctomycetaceae bacterium]